MMHKKELEQIKLAQKVALVDGFFKIELVAGVDSAFLSDKIISAVVVMGKSTKKDWFMCKLEQPYQSGFLMYTEGPCMIKALKQLKEEPDLIFVDGHGIAHPRKAGLACYIGVKMGLPTIGIAKKVLVGKYKEPESEKEAAPLSINGEQAGWVLKPGKSFSPIFVSPGHLVSLESSLKLTLKFLKTHKLPEPLFQAHKYVNEVRRSVLER